ncbi:hypothetical protein C7974DRAFT_375171 [Boeremia exigua]|uniref:uncharacterized protein n=1 Tax=Boeremia exigua TaxID=749465 RepID=UPI001E8ED2D4|nr:uncharacterized protein C7974DRAFT_375171 [Boeremia exigua]KAH6633024.1 hypothetical protein C7974DRAFT_375171 [Boeremia exigua]
MTAPLGVAVLLIVEESGAMEVRSRCFGSSGYTSDVSELVVEYERLGDRDTRRDEIDDVRLFKRGASDTGTSDRLLAWESGRKKETVLDLRKACLSILSLSSSLTDFLTSGSLNSSFPFLSDAKYSSPRPKTTWSEAQSRVVPSVGLSHSFNASGRS